MAVHSEPLSPRNAEVARLRALTHDRRARHEAGRFVVEGAKLVSEAFASDLVVLEVYATPGWLPDDATRSAIEAAGIELTLVSHRGIERIASTTSPQPVIAEVMLPTASWSDLGTATAMLVAVDVNDPGNLGTLARSALAAGFDALVALGSTTDPFGPKAVRASAGAVLRLPVPSETDAVKGLSRLGELGLARFGTRTSDAEACDEADLTGKVALVLGSEANGLDDIYTTHIDRWLAVPMAGPVESLNVAMAGAILTYETARQRRHRGER